MAFNIIRVIITCLILPFYNCRYFVFVIFVSLTLWFQHQKKTLTGIHSPNNGAQSPVVWVYLFPEKASSTLYEFLDP